MAQDLDLFALETSGISEFVSERTGRMHCASDVESAVRVCERGCFVQVSWRSSTV